MELKHKLGKCLCEDCKAELREKDARFAEEYMDYDENDLRELIKEILGE